MNPILRNILAVLAGIVVAGIVNMAIIMVSGSVITPPEGVDPNDMESIKANIDRFEAKHFLSPFLAHAFGALVGAFVAARLAASHRMSFAMGIGAFNLLGGVMAATMIPAPTWFIVADLALAYLPMGWIGGRLATGRATAG